MKRIFSKLPLRKKLLRFTSIVALLILAGVYVCNGIIVRSTQGKLYNDLSRLPANKVGLLLGTSKYLSSGYVNLYYQYRIDAAAELLRSGKIKYLVLSGDNGRNDYNEPEQMRADLIRAGVDSNALYLDYAGFRTFDSMIRLREIFGQNSVTVISQRFHNERAIYIATRLHIQAIGYNAKDVHYAGGFKTMLREKLARVKVILDFLISTKPRYLGEPVNIPA